jgi:hypothetical protein
MPAVCFSSAAIIYLARNFLLVFINYFGEEKKFFLKTPPAMKEVF